MAKKNVIVIICTSCQDNIYFDVKDFMELLETDYFVKSFTEYESLMEFIHKSPIKTDVLVIALPEPNSIDSCHKLLQDPLFYGKVLIIGNTTEHRLTAKQLGIDFVHLPASKEEIIDTINKLLGVKISSGLPIEDIKYITLDNCKRHMDELSARISEFEGNIETSIKGLRADMEQTLNIKFGIMKEMLASYTKDTERITKDVDDIQRDVINLQKESQSAEATKFNAKISNRGLIIVAIVSFMGSLIVGLFSNVDKIIGLFK